MYHDTNWLFSLFTCFVFTFTDAGQQCIEDTIRIVGGPNEFEGRVEICIGGVWGQVCGGTGWDSVDAQVVCQQLGYSSIEPQAFIGNFHGTGDGPGLIENVACTGTENTLGECPYMAINITSGCSETNNVIVVCQDEVCFNDTENVRLVGGDSDTVGRVEICSTSFFRRGVCDTNWDEDDARVACEELGLLLDDTDPQTTFYDGIRYFGSILTNVSCNGDEMQLRRCFSEQTRPLPRCSLSGVRCQRINLTGIETEPSTTIESSGTQASFTSEAPTDLEATTRQSVPNNNTLAIGIGLGVVGGLLLLLVVAVLVVVLVFILGRKHDKKVTFETQETIKEWEDVEYTYPYVNNVTDQHVSQTEVHTTSNISYQTAISNIASTKNKAYGIIRRDQNGSTDIGNDNGSGNNECGLHYETVT